MFGRTADYAIRAMLLLAREHVPGRFLGADQIADGIGGPRNYTSKVLHTLAKAGMVTSLRGPFGGFQIAKPAHEISLGSLIDLFFTPSASDRCLNGNRPCDPQRPCSAHQRWRSVISAQRAPLDATTLADLVDARPVPLVRRRALEAVTNTAPSLSTRERSHVIR